MSRPRSLRARWRQARGTLLALLVPVVAWALRPLGWRGTQWLGRAVGAAAWRLARRDRRRTLEHLTLAFPGLDPAEHAALGRRSFQHLATVLLECLVLRTSRPETLRSHVEVEGFGPVAELQEQARPVLVVTGHCGNWELLAATINQCGLPLTVVARQADEDRLDRLLVGFRARFGTQTIARGTPGAARKLLGTLRSGGALGMLIDQDTKVEGDWVPFFDHPAFTPLGAAQIALRHGAVVVPTFIERRADGSHRAVFHPPLDLPDDPVAATAVMTRAIEEQIRRVPEQWVWLHRRWRRQPSPE